MPLPHLECSVGPPAGALIHSPEHNHCGELARQPKKATIHCTTSPFLIIGDQFCRRLFGQLRGYNKFRSLLYMFGVPHLT